MYVKWGATALLIAVFSQAAATQRPDTRPTALDFRRVGDLATGDVAAREGTVDATGLRFSIPNLSVLQPVEVWISAPDASRPVRVEVRKFGFEGVLRRTETGNDGLAVLQFRTEQGVTLELKAAHASPAEFQLVAWVGDELATIPTTRLRPLRESDRRTTHPSRSTVTFVSAGALLVALAVAGFFKSRRTR